jgi:predicted dehydrogenase
MSIDVIKIGVIGCGGMGRAHVDAITENPHFNLVAGCDINPDVLNQLPDNVKRYSKAKNLFAENKLDAVSIILPNHLYKQMVKLAAENGVHVFCEKPLGKNITDCREIVRCACRAGINGWVGGQRKYIPHIWKALPKVKELAPDFVASSFTYWWQSAFGDIGWRGDKNKSGGVAVIDSGWHILDLLSFFLGEPESVFAQLNYLKEYPDIDDKASIRLQYPNAVAELLVSYTWPRDQFSCTFTNGERAIHLDLNRFQYFINGETVEEEKKTHNSHPFNLMYNELYKALKGDENVYLTDFKRAENIMKVVDACYRSERERESIAF